MFKCDGEDYEYDKDDDDYGSADDELVEGRLINDGEDAYDVDDRC